MSEKRKDNKGRILRTGESQRKDGIYQYRYTDTRGKRQTVYSSDLKGLREREQTIQRDLDDHIDYAAGEITLAQLVERYLGLKQNLRYNTQKQYSSRLKFIKAEEFCKRCVRDIKPSDMKAWVIELHAQGRSYNSIHSIRSIIRSALDLALDENIIRKNPFDFKLNEVLRKDFQARPSLTPDQQKAWLNFIAKDEWYCKYYDEVIILLGTGLRVSEFCGLTKGDLDFEKRKIRIERQLIRESGGAYHVADLKSKSGRRFVPMSESVARSLNNVLKKRNPKTEMIIDGCTGFVFLTKTGTPKLATSVERVVRQMSRLYQQAHPNECFPHVTPHVLRHTFCTNMANAGMNIKSLQYIMGHSNVSTTLSIYAHASYESAAEQMLRITDGAPTTTPNTTPLASRGM